MAVSTIPSNGWRYIDTISIGDSADLPSKINDVFIRISPGSDNNFYRCLSIPATILTSSFRYYIFGDYQSNGIGSQCILNCKTNAVKLVAVYDNGTSMTASKADVYCR